ncbi:transcriptional regulator HexR [Neptunomonas phycophila]|uniref:Transcriptional regulator HexR n=1 Tax=Neptunomonas phycophila TaxID=1572645 RepID=A0AAW7XKB5_9GAMM|nr:MULTISPECIES: transcriptional regulator HexR [Neptunomonas]MBT3145748.1 transcriptional regulator HexR [Neptunomonas phycophila]MDN2660245.1 transcriptional regulator HexR [Neptunomonas sp. CHC150]MDO6453270.1 transcriptional regulator HexR [Neptunomonas phycophila]MDO6469373.1 transcriptional regulator HexR [Neptunomonas phycophila]MDO6784293.1 transcriptional regulator HexR [Neptunomonas phycophila]
MNSANLLKSITDARPKLRKSEQKVADFVLLNPNDVIHMRIVDLAAQAQVSEPTVVRFCRALHYDGFQDFKLTLAQGLASSTNFEQFALDSKDTVAEFKQKIFDSMIGNMVNIRDQLDAATLESAIDALVKAKRIEFYGFGASAAVCSDAQHKFYRLQISAAAYSDPHMQTISAVSMSKSDVVVAISQTGRTKDLLHTAKLVKEAGATLITLCPSHTPLAEIATIPIHIDIEEDKDLSTLMSSRVMHLVVIDILAVGVAMRLGPALIDHLKTIKRSLRSLRQNDKRLITRRNDNADD